MDGAIREVNRRRKIQVKYNQDHHITPKSVVKSIRPQIIEDLQKQEKTNWSKIDTSSLTPPQRQKQIKALKKQMREFAFNLDFEQAIQIRDQIKEIEKY
jgi:excinuclease ABC subunit B